jgi:cobaltochelatase CobS
MTATRAMRTDLTEAEHLLIPKKNPAYYFPKFSDDVGQDVMESKKVCLTGHMGCGKTSLVEQMAAQIGNPVIRVNMNGQTTIADFVGFWTVKGGETVWVDGALPLAMRRGYWLIIDEIDFAEAQILSVLNPVTEKDGKLFLKEKGHEIIVPHEKFRLFATANTVGIMEAYRHLYQGANILNKALLDRFRVYHVDYLPATQEATVLSKTVNGIPVEAAQVLVKLANQVREAFNKEELSSTFSLRQLIDWGEMLMRKRDAGLRPEISIIASAETCIFSKVSKEDGAVIRQLIERHCMGGRAATT